MYKVRGRTTIMGYLNLKSAGRYINKHAVIFTVALCLTLGASAVAAQSGHNMSIKDDQQAQQQADVTLAAKKVHDTEAAKLQAKIYTECMNEKKYYGLLTLAQRKTVIAPDCDNIAVNL